MDVQFDFDDLDRSLQKQWQKDRATKALKRQERYLKRLEAQPSKANRKKAKRAGVSGLEMRFEQGSVSSMPDMHRIDGNIRAFIETSERQELALPPMDKKYRYAIHMLAEAYR